MLPIEEMGKKDLENIKMLCFDSDGVTVEKGTKFLDSGWTITQDLSPEMGNKMLKLKDKFWINVTSGRNLEFLKKRYELVLGDKFSLQAEIGNIGWYKDGEFRELWSEYELERVEKIRKILEEKLLRMDDFIAFEEKEMIITIHAKNEIELINKTVKENDEKGWLYCWWNGEAYDIGPKRFNKASGLKKMADILGINMDEIMIVGNGINDRDMRNGVGIDVSTDPKSLKADFWTEGEEVGGEKLVDRILKLV
ncbi:hypothetical protein A2367_03140 [Candidatus Shapirobacteria bacterium RIFOXYB1_FULL_38_38]|uniref:Uncharacterized protein n=2 Tax=Candidatus Shapironibacteriota TaxID=1752721 RepID=A0A0G0JR29_9BACT|nr:MAG: hypothetical protein US90_C0018G0016 [Candidatus Shapirobacteria bacterium GW2011_GWE2_38_30]OGL56005.1 MAG: hypothetical protein A2367_03140 [Candidatus Shapirobacteria bacterium RIFOXYB1_FULL_38_38]